MDHIAVREGIESDMSQSLSTGTQTARGMVGVRHKHVITAVKIQWRALLLACAACGTVLFYWLFYFTQINRLTNVEQDRSLTEEWLNCMLNTNNDQDACAAVLKGHLPPFSLMIVAETLVSLVGVWLFLTFCKRSLWREWNDRIYEIRVALGIRGQVEKNGEQFVAL
ncbi:hypothetical protein EC973_000649 [Apophysomyces ossiformis]|uniref:Uncharacterized protein n=1 Tax=Apophysomyces ossiformis TaxID=679940 RepID=A0A8H7BUG2_9FUNG|nr:hypothetical protein EC973_000649 [Apophysomyces ossiformis]